MRAVDVLHDLHKAVDEVGLLWAPLHQPLTEEALLLGQHRDFACVFTAVHLFPEALQ